MGGISAEVLAQLTKGISEVMTTEFGPTAEPLINAAERTAYAAEGILQELSFQSFGVGQYRSVKDVVDAAAQQIETDFAITGIKTRMEKIFSELRNGGFSGDHSDSEDDQLLSILKNKKEEMSQEIIDSLLQTFQKYYDLSKKVANANKAIYANQNFQDLTYRAGVIMQNGYQILTQMGELINGTQIIYEVQVSVGSKGSHRTAYMTLSDIMQYTTASYHGGEMRLRLNEAAINKAVNEGKLDIFHWTEDYRQSYLQYVSRTKTAQTMGYTNWDKNKGITESEDAYINRGNVTEAFRRAAAGIAETSLDSAFQHSLSELEGMRDTQQLHYLIHTQIAEILKNTVAFWQGPDFTADIKKLFNGLIMSDEAKNNLIENLGISGVNQIGVQEKVSGASFANLTQLVTQLNAAVNSLRVIINHSNGNIQSAIDPSVADGIDEEVEQAVLELVSQFLGV